MKAIGSKFIAKVSPSFSFSWDELVFNLNFTPPIQEKYQNGQAKLINLLSRPNIIKLFTLKFNLTIQLQTETSNRI